MYRWLGCSVSVRTIHPASTIGLTEDCKDAFVLVTDVEAGIQIVGSPPTDHSALVARFKTAEVV